MRVFEMGPAGVGEGAQFVRLSFVQESQRQEARSDKGDNDPGQRER